MSRKIRIAAALFAALILAVFAWLWIDAEADKNSAPPNTAPPEAALTETPPEPPSIQAEDSDGEANEAAANAVDAYASQDSPYRFESWEDTADHIAELVGQEFDKLLLTESYNHPAELAPRAFMDTIERFWNGSKEHLTPENRALHDAVFPFMPVKYSLLEDGPHRMPTSEFTSFHLLVRAGRLSPDMLKIHIRLPNGEKYTAERNERVVVTYQIDHSMNAELQERISALEARALDLEAQLSATPGGVDLQTRLDNARMMLERSKKNLITTHRREMGAVNRGQPGFKITEMDLGTLRAEDLPRTSDMRDRPGYGSPDLQSEYFHEYLRKSAFNPNR